VSTNRRSDTFYFGATGESLRLSVGAMRHLTNRSRHPQQILPGMFRLATAHLRMSPRLAWVPGVKALWDVNLLASGERQRNEELRSRLQQSFDAIKGIFVRSFVWLGERIITTPTITRNIKPLTRLHVTLLFVATGSYLLNAQKTVPSCDRVCEESRARRAFPRRHSCLCRTPQLKRRKPSPCLPRS